MGSDKNLNPSNPPPYPLPTPLARPLKLCVCDWEGWLTFCGIASQRAGFLYFGMASHCFSTDSFAVLFFEEEFWTSRAGLIFGIPSPRAGFLNFGMASPCFFFFIAVCLC